METSEKITQLENEIKVLKNEVQAVLLDIRENVLNAENPFTAQKPVVTSQVVIDRQVQATAPPPSVSEIKPSPSPTSAPASVPIPATSLQEKKPIDMAPAEEIHTPENNGSKPQNNNYNRSDSLQKEQNETNLPRFENCESLSNRRQPDLVAYAGLACWVEDSTRRLGKERTQAMLEISEVAGFLPAEVKKILTRLTNMELTEHSYKPSARDYFDSLVKLSTVFGNNNENNAALLLMLAQGDVHG